MSCCESQNIMHQERMLQISVSSSTYCRRSRCAYSKCQFQDIIFVQVGLLNTSHRGDGPFLETKYSINTVLVQVKSDHLISRKDHGPKGRCWLPCARDENVCADTGARCIPSGTCHQLQNRDIRLVITFNVEGCAASALGSGLVTLFEL